MIKQLFYSPMFLAEIYKKKKNNFSKNGFALVTSTFIMLLLLSLGIYATSFVLTDIKISESQALSVKTYYLAESGIAEAIWRIKNDSTWKNNFETNPNWSISYQRNSALYPNSSYTIEVNNTEEARGQIMVTANINKLGKQSQRVVKTFIYKALGENPIGQNAEYSDGNIDMSGTVLRVHGGGLFSNNNIIINYHSVIDSDGPASAVRNILEHGNSKLNSPSRHSANNPPAPDPIPMPAVSFDNPSDPNSYKNLADQVYTKKQFEDLLWANRGQTLTLNGIHYVTGDVEIYGINDVTINGVLVADGNVVLGKNSTLCCWGWSCLQRGNIVINKPSTTSPSGILSKRKIELELCLNSLNAHGLIYSTDKIDVLSLPNSITIKGGLITRKLTMTSLWQGIDLIYDNETIMYSLGDAIYSPVVTIEHWEEEY